MIESTNDIELELRTCVAAAASVLSGAQPPGDQAARVLAALREATQRADTAIAEASHG